MSTKGMARTHPVVSRPASRTNNLITLVTKHTTTDPTSSPSLYPSSEHDTYLLDNRRVTDNQPNMTSVFVDRCSPSQCLQPLNCDVTQPGGETKHVMHEPNLLTTGQADQHQGTDTTLTCARSFQQISYLPSAEVQDKDLQQTTVPGLARRNRRKCFSAAQRDHVTWRDPPPDLELLVPRVKGRAPKTCMASTKTNSPTVAGALARGMSCSLVLCRSAILYIRQKPVRPSVVVPHPLLAKTPRRPNHHLVSLSYTTKAKHPSTVTTAGINPTTQNNCLRQISMNTHVPRPRIVIPPSVRKVRRRSRRLRTKPKDEGCEPTERKIDSEICLSEKRNSSRSSHKYISPWGTMSESGSGSLTPSECSNTSLYRHKPKRKRRNKHGPVKSAKKKQLSPSSSGKSTKKAHDFWDAILSSARKTNRRSKRSFRTRLSPQARTRLSPQARTRLSPQARTRLSPQARTRLSPQARTAGYVSATRRSETPKQRMRNIACCKALAAPPYLGAATPYLGAAPPNLMGAASDAPQNKPSEHQLDNHNTSVLIEAVKVIDMHRRSRPAVRLHVKTSDEQSQEVRSLEKQDQQVKTLENLNKPARNCVKKAPTKKCASLPNLPVSRSSRWNQDAESHDPHNKHTEPHDPQNKHTEPHNKHTEPHDHQNKHTEPRNAQKLIRFDKNSTMSPSEIDIISYRKASNARRLDVNPCRHPGVGDTRVTPRPLVSAVTSRQASGRVSKEGKQSGLAAGSRAGGEGTAPSSPSKPVKDGANRMLEAADKQGNVQVKRKTKMAKNK